MVKNLPDIQSNEQSSISEPGVKQLQFVDFIKVQWQNAQPQQIKYFDSIAPYQKVKNLQGQLMMSLLEYSLDPVKNKIYKLELTSSPNNNTSTD